MSAKRVHGCERFNLQNTSGGGDARRRSSPDHLGRLEEERWGNGEAERLRGLEVDDQLERGGLLDGEVSGLPTLDEFVYISGGALPEVGGAWSISHEAPPPQIAVTRKSPVARLGARVRRCV